MAPSSITEQPKWHHFKKQIIFLKIMGISFTGNESIAYKLYSFLLISTTVFTYTFLDGYEMFKHDFETSSGIIIYESMIVLTMFKTTVVLINRIKFGEVLAKLQQKPFLPNPDRGGKEEEKLIRDCNWKIDALIYVYWVATGITVFGSGAYAISTRIRSDDYHDWEMSFGPFTALNVTHSPNYEISWFYQCFSVAVVTTHFTTIDLTIIGVLAHLSYQFKILQNFLQVIITRSYKEMLKEDNTNDNSTQMIPSEHDIDVSKIPWKYLQKSIEQAVGYHQAIIDAAEEMESFFRYLFMLTFLTSLACLCFELYNALSQQTVLALMRNILEYCTIVFQVGMMCYWGEQVKFESQQVAEAVAKSNYVGSDVRFQKALVLIISRSQRPTKLTAGKFAEICLTTFTWFMRTSYTLFMLVRNLNGSTM